MCKWFYIPNHRHGASKFLDYAYYTEICRLVYGHNRPFTKTVMSSLEGTRTREVDAHARIFIHSTVKKENKLVECRALWGEPEWK